MGAAIVLYETALADNPRLTEYPAVSLDNGTYPGRPYPTPRTPGVIGVRLNAADAPLTVPAMWT